MSAGEVLVLGSGTSNGVPMLGVRYPKEFLANPKNHRCRTCVVIRGPNGNLLVDCPPELRLLLTGAEIYDVEAVLITHSHADHVMGMDDLRSFSMISGRPVRVYANEGTQEDIRRIFPYAFKEMPGGIAVPRFDLQPAPSVLSVGGLEVRILEVRHGGMPVLGFRVGACAYLTDLNEIPAAARSELDGLETLVLDAVRVKPHPTHYHLEAALEVAAEIGARRTYLTHLSHDFDHDVTNRSLPAGVELAYDGLVIGL